MNPLQRCLVALSAGCLAGCAGGPQPVDTAIGLAAIGSEATATSAASSAIGTAAANAAATDSADATADGASSAAAAQPLVVDANELAATTPQVICREMLRPNSNVISRYCGTAEAWRKYEQQQARQAQELVRMFQGGRYR